MPNPISRVNPSAAIHISNSNDSPSAHRPQLALLAMSVLAEWSILESWVNGLFVVLSGTNAKTATAIYSSLSGSAAKRVAFDAVAKEYLKPKEIEVYTVLTAMIGRVRNQRNKLAHGVWGHSPQIPDGVLICDALEMMKFTIAVYEYDHAPAGKKVMPDLPKDKIFVYYDTYFKNLSASINRIMGYVMEFRFAILRPKKFLGTAEALDQLVQSPEIHQALTRLREKNQAKA